MEEEKMKVNKDLNYDSKKQAKSVEDTKISETVKKANSGKMEHGVAEDEVTKALARCHKLIEDMSSRYIPSNADFGRKVSMLKDSATSDFRNRLEVQGIENLEKIVLETAQDAIKPIVPVEDKGKKPISKEEKRRKAFDRAIEKSFYQGLEQDNERTSDLVENLRGRFPDLTKASENVKKDVNELITEDDRQAIENAQNDEERFVIAEILKEELEGKDKNGNLKDVVKYGNICKAISIGDMKYAEKLAQKYKCEDIIKIDENGNQTIDSEKVREKYVIENVKLGFGFGKDDEIPPEILESAMESPDWTFEGIKNVFQETIKNLKENHADEVPHNERDIEKYVERNYRRQVFLDLTKLEGEEFEKSSREWIKGNVESSKKFLKEIEITPQMDKNYAEKLKALGKMTDEAFKAKLNDDLMQNKNISDDIIIDIPASQDYLKELIGKNNPNINNQIMLLQEGIKQAEKEKLKEALSKDYGTFEEEIKDLVNLNPSVAQEFLKEFVTNPENANTKDYQPKVFKLQESITETMNNRTVGKEKSIGNREGNFLSAENIDVSKLAKESGKSILDDPSNENRAQEDDEGR